MSQSTLIDSSTLISKTNQTTSTSAVYNVALGTDVTFQVSGSQVSSGTGTLKLQQSCDDVTYFDVSGDSLTINGTVTALWVQSPVTTQYYKVVYTASSGGTNFTVLVNLFCRVGNGSL